MGKPAHNRHTPESFWARVAKRGPDECWPWLGATNRAGYGQLCYQGVYGLASRVAAFLEDMIPEIRAPRDRTEAGFVLHSCDNPPCCNPWHFEIGTLSKNQSDAYARGLKRQPQSRHANAKLSSSDVVGIRRRYAAKEMSQDKLALEYRVSQRVISLVVRRETYRDV